VSKLAKWYRKDISPSSVSDKTKPSGLHKHLRVRQVIATYALRSQSRNLLHIVTGINSIRETAEPFEVAANRNWWRI